MSNQVNIQVLCNDPDLYPTKATLGSAAFDLRIDKVAYDNPCGFIKVHTGLRVAFPSDYVLLVYPRSGLAAKYGLRLANGVGVIDSDYRGEIMLMMDYSAEFSSVVKELQRGNRIAQAILQPIPQTRFVFVKELSETVRGTGGFGHTGTK